MVVVVVLERRADAVVDFGLAKCQKPRVVARCRLWSPKRGFYILHRNLFDSDCGVKFYLIKLSLCVCVCVCVMSSVPAAPSLIRGAWIVFTFGFVFSNCPLATKCHRSHEDRKHDPNSRASCLDTTHSAAAEQTAKMSGTKQNSSKRRLLHVLAAHSLVHPQDFACKQYAVVAQGHSFCIMSRIRSD